MRLNRLVLLPTAMVVLVGLTGCSTRHYGKPDRAPSQLSFGVDMAKRGLWSEALFRFEQAGKLDPGNAHVFNNMAVAAEAVGDFDQARELYDKALRLAPGDPAVKRNYARFVEFYNNYNADREPAGEAANEDSEQAGPDAEPPSEDNQSVGGDGAVL